jgi:hypothetical protein
MLGKVNKLISRRQKVLGVFIKLIRKLEKHNSKLEKLHARAEKEIEYHKVAAEEINNLISSNAKTMSKIEEFTK